ncbi:MAG TPA: lactonase family protein [Nocardioidaceae bacterium]|nr:lactonase family protein [Nocardioidaceae bacterium]
MTPTPTTAVGRWWIGSFSTTSTPGAITSAVADPDTGVLRRRGDALTAHNASYLARGPSGLVYAVLENDDGQVAAFAPTDDGGLRPHGDVQSTGGAGPCHVAVSAEATCVFVANYGSGSVAVLPIAPDGSLRSATDVRQHEGHGPDDRPGGRQTEPHAHMAIDHRGRDGDRIVLVADLGIDRVVRYRLDAGRLRRDREIAMPAGSGPRHLCVRGSYAYVAGELDSSLTVLDLDGAEGPSIVDTVRTIEFGETSFPSAIRLSTDGRRCYVANRGPDTIAVFDVDGPGVRLRANVSAGGEHPRDLALSPNGRNLYVANQASDAVQAFAVDPDSGMPSAVGEPLAVSQPSCLLPA